MTGITGIGEQAEVGEMKFPYHSGFRLNVLHCMPYGKSGVNGHEQHKHGTDHHENNKEV
jgi:hypothetical protein